MKMTDEHYNRLKAAIARIWDPCCPMRYAMTGKSPDRLRWDLLHASKFPVGILYSAGLDDGHIDTALRRIVRFLIEKSK